MTPLERAARALHDDTQRHHPVFDPDPAEPRAVQNAPFIVWDALPQDARTRYFGQARAVLQAIREPSPLMIVAALEMDPIAQFDVTPDESWKEMIDAALEEG